MAEISGQEVRVYTSTPDRAVLVELAEGVDPSGLRVSSTLAYTFYGEYSGEANRCEPDYGCHALLKLVNALWTP